MDSTHYSNIICHNIKMKGKPVVIWAVADVHLGSILHKEQEWASFCRSVIKEENNFVVLAGDMLDNTLKSSVGEVYDNTLRPAEQRRILTEQLKPLAAEGRILAAIAGNHEYRSKKETDDEPLFDILARLGVEHIYRDGMAVVKIQMNDTEKDGKSNPTYTLLVHHGAGGGGTTGAAINKAEGFAAMYDGVDAFIFGHWHKPIVSNQTKICIDPHNKRVSEKPVKIIVASAWMNYGSYGLRGMMKPATFAPQQLILHTNKKKMEVLG